MHIIYLLYIIAGIVVGVGSFIGIARLGSKSKDDANAALVIENTSIRNQRDDSDKKVANRDQEIARLQVRAEKAEKNEQYLKELAQSKPDFGKLTLQLATQHKEMMTVYTDGTNKMIEELGNLAQVIVKDRKNG